MKNNETPISIIISIITIAILIFVGLKGLETVDPVYPPDFLPGTVEFRAGVELRKHE